MKTTIRLLTLALLLTARAWAQSQPKPHVAVAGVVVGHSVEYVAVRDTNSVPQFQIVRGKKVALPPRQVSRLTYVRGLPNWQSYAAGTRLALPVARCELVSDSEAVRTVQVSAPPAPTGRPR